MKEPSVLLQPTPGKHGWEAHSSISSLHVRPESTRNTGRYNMETLHHLLNNRKLIFNTYLIWCLYCIPYVMHIKVTFFNLQWPWYKTELSIKINWRNNFQVDYIFGFQFFLVKASLLHVIPHLSLPSATFNCPIKAQNTPKNYLKNQTVFTSGQHSFEKLCLGTSLVSQHCTWWLKCNITNRNNDHNLKNKT